MSIFRLCILKKVLNSETPHAVSLLKKDEGWQSAEECRSKEQDESFPEPSEDVPILLYHTQQGSGCSMTHQHGCFTTQEKNT